MNELEDVVKHILLANSNVDLILLTGSFATQSHTKYSDIDIVVLTREEIKTSHEYMIKNIDSKKRLITIEYVQFRALLDSLKDYKLWPFVQQYQHARVLYDENNHFETLCLCIQETKPLPESYFSDLEKNVFLVFEYLAKVKSAYEKKDVRYIIFAAKNVAYYSSLCFKPFNKIRCIASERDLYESLHSYIYEPENFTQLFCICYGLTIEKKSFDELYVASHEMVQSLFQFLKKNNVSEKIPSLHQVFTDDYFTDVMHIK